MARRKRSKKKKEVSLAEMLMDEKLRKLLVEIGGENTLPVLSLLENEPLTDEKLAEMLNVRVNDVRAVLNKLHPHGIVMYERTRNEDGWYYYTWTLKKNKVLKILSELSQQDKSDDFYCPTCEVYYNFDEAYDNNFMCPECGTSLVAAEAKEWNRRLMHTSSRSRKKAKF